MTKQTNLQHRINFRSYSLKESISSFKILLTSKKLVRIRGATDEKFSIHFHFNSYLNFLLFDDISKPEKMVTCYGMF